MENFDFVKLRRDLIDYFGTAMYNVSIATMGDIEKIERASEQELLEIANENGFDLNNYIV